MAKTDFQKFDFETLFVPPKVVKWEPTEVNSCFLPNYPKLGTLFFKVQHEKSPMENKFYPFISIWRDLSFNPGLSGLGMTLIGLIPSFSKLGGYKNEFCRCK